MMSLLKLLLKQLMLLVNYMLIGLCHSLRPILGPAACKFEPTCGNFAVQELATKPIHQALWAIIKRLVHCNPFYAKKV